MARRFAAVFICVSACEIDKIPAKEIIMNCWEFMKCSEKTSATCPAYPNKGLDCWKVTGTKCDSGRMETKNIQEKILFCRSCEFYKTYAHRF